MVAVRLWACIENDCPTLWYRNPSGLCPRCGVLGERAVWPIVPPGRVED